MQVAYYFQIREPRNNFHRKIRVVLFAVFNNFTLTTQKQDIKQWIDNGISEGKRETYAQVRPVAKMVSRKIFQKYIARLAPDIF